MEINRILVTGGTGFVGRWMAWAQPDKTDVTYIGRMDYQTGEWLHGDWDAIVHLAPISPRLALTKCKRLLYCSSGAAYDQQTEYAENKRRWEMMCFESGVDVVIARLFTFYGEGLDEGKAYTQFTKAAKANSTITITGDGSTTRSYMHGSELGRWMWAILLNGASGEIYDVGSDTPITMIELARAIKRMHNSDSSIIILHGTDPMPYYMPKNTAKTKGIL